MTFNEYQKFVKGLLSPETLKDQMVNAALGLAGEAGEYADMVKKYKHHGHEFDRRKALLELGDILFYICSAADEQGATLEEVVFLNVDKLTKRYPKGHFDIQDSINRVDQTIVNLNNPITAITVDCYDAHGGTIKFGPGIHLPSVELSGDINVLGSYQTDTWIASEVGVQEVEND